MSIDLSLSRLSNLLPHLPLRYTRPTIHIAGTNGKGSVSALLSSIFTQAESTPKLSVGRFNSPHLVHITDCILINEKAVVYDDYLSARNSVVDTDGKYGGGEGSRLTPFEVLTLTALQLFEKARVDVAVVEVGMGGLTDATNVIPSECILASALTAVDLDHQGFLGNTITAISNQKAGIARPGKPFVLGNQIPENRQEVENAVRKVVERTGAMLVRPVQVEKTRDDLPPGPSEYFEQPRETPVRFTVSAASPEPIQSSLPLHGVHQLDNLATALGVIQALLSLPSPTQLNLQASLTPKAISTGVSNVQWKGRLSWHTYNTHPVLVDGAHNPASSKTLHDYIQQIIPSKAKKVHITYVLALSHSPPKQPRDTLTPLLSPLASAPQVSASVALVPFTPPSNMPWVKYVPPSDLATVVHDILGGHGSIWTPESVDILQEGASNTYLQSALEWAASQDTEEGKDCCT